jgi:hypothetical protein
MGTPDRYFESVPWDTEKEAIAAWFGRAFVHGLQQDAAPSHWPTEREPDAGIFPITLLCLSYVTAAAGLVLGITDADTVEVVDFIRDWFGRSQERSGDRYREYAAALYPLFRHGLAHQRHPGLLDIGDGRNLGWALGRETNRDGHLVLRHAGLIERTTGRRISYLLSVQADVLFVDTLHAFGAIQNAASADDVLAGRIRDGACKAKTRYLKGRTKEKLLPVIQAALDAVDAATPPVP